MVRFSRSYTRESANYDFQWNREISAKAFIPNGTECLHGHLEFDAFDEIYPKAFANLVEDPLIVLFLSQPYNEYAGS